MGEGLKRARAAARATRIGQPMTAVEYRDLEPEADFMVKVKDLAERCRWLCYHTYDSRRSDEGFVDLVMVRRRRVIFAELKSVRGKLREKQKVWLDALIGAGMEAVVWHPSDWDAIVATLR